MTEYSRFWGCYSPWVFFGCCDPQSSQKNPQLPESGRTGRTPNTQKQYHPVRQMLHVWLLLPKPWSGRIEKCHVFSGILFCSFIYYLFSIGRFNSDSHDHDIWIAPPPSLVGFLIGESDLKTAFWSLDFPTKNSPLAGLEDGKMLSLKKALGTDGTNIIPFLGQAGYLYHDLISPSWELTYPLKSPFWRWCFLFPRWDMLISWRVGYIFKMAFWKMTWIAKHGMFPIKGTEYDG